MIAYACVCPEDCEAALAIVDVADCLNQYELEQSEISDVYFSIEDPLNPGQPLYGPTDWTLAADWALAINNAIPGAVKHLSGIGDKPAPEETEVTVEKFQTLVLTRKHTINFDVMHMTDANYAFARLVQCGATFVMWFATVGGKLYGGQDGFSVSAKANLVKERGEGSFAVASYTLTWNAKCDPPRIDNPMAGAEVVL